MRHILAPVDFSDVTPLIVDKAREIAEQFHARVTLLHVAVFGVGTVVPGFMPVCIEARGDLSRLQEMLDLLKNRFPGSMVRVDTHVVEGGLVAERILAECERVRVDLIVMGTHGHGRFYEALVGSVTSHVVESAKCPVLVVPAGCRASANSPQETEAAVV